MTFACNGAKGDKGDVGQAGADGTTFVRPTEVVGALVTVPADGTNVAFAFCPAGKIAIGGGLNSPSLSDVSVTKSFRNGSQEAWSVRVWNHTANPQDVHALIYCE